MKTSAFTPARLLRWLLLSSALGIFAGLAAVVYQYLVEKAVVLFQVNLMGVGPESPVYHETGSWLGAVSSPNLLMVALLPATGGLLVGILLWLRPMLLRSDADDDEIKSFLENNGDYPFARPIYNLFLSVITLGTGGSGGKEAPAGSAGAAIGSLMGRVLKVDVRTRRVLLAAGVAAGIGAIFRIPVAAAFFAAEFYYSDVELEAGVLLPAGIASAVAYFIFAQFYGFSPLLDRATGIAFGSVWELVPFLILSVLSCPAAYLFVSIFKTSSRWFHGLRIPAVIKPMAGGLGVGLTCLAAYLVSRDQAALSIVGDGFGILHRVVSGEATTCALLLLAVAILKMISTSLTLGSGGVAGLFSPSLVIGGIMGGAFGLLANACTPSIAPHPQAFVLIGMTAFFSSAFKAPVCAVFVASELAGDYSLLLPSMIASAVSFMLGGSWSLISGQLPSKSIVSPDKA
ncbi:MAG: chloride channel protein [Myxococcota bacterium]|jgi:CIC family chloride channel protein